VQCGSCNARETLASRATRGQWDWEVVLVERVSSESREIDFASPEEIAAADSGIWQPRRTLGEIPQARETSVLLRHGFGRWADLYPRRQQAALECLLDACAELDASRDVAVALKFAVVGFAEMAGYLARWDRYYLRSYEVMAAHRFSFTTLPVELNPWAGWAQGGRGSVPSRLRSLLKAAGWLSDKLTRPLHVHVRQGTEPQESWPSKADAVLVCGDSARMLLPDREIDLVLTDPPYFDDIHYDDLSRLLRLWAGLPSETLTEDAVPASPLPIRERRSHYRRVLADVFREANRALALEGHLVLTFSNRDPKAWVDLFEALQKAGFQAAGCAAIHSENETDLSKRGRRACRFDLVASAFRQLGNLVEGWAEQFLRQCRDCRFLQAPAKKRSLKKRAGQPF
jgi:putative DNA methylase